MSIERRIEALEGRHKPARVHPELHAQMDGSCLHPRCRGKTSQEQAAIHRGRVTYCVCFDEGGFTANAL